MSDPQKAKAGRPPKPPDLKKQKPNITLDPRLISKAKTKASALGMGFSEFVSEALEHELERLDSGAGLETTVLSSASNVVPIPKKAPRQANVITLPFLGAVAAGEPVSAPRDETIVVSKRYPANHFVVEVNGQSMEPDFPDGSRWVVDGRDKFTPKDGQACVISDGSGSYLKVWDRKARVFRSKNPNFNHITPGPEAKLQGYPVEQI